MLVEIKKFGGHAKEADMGAFNFAEHRPIDPNITVFRYNLSKLRAIDALEEILHWQQIKEGGSYWRDYSNNPLFKKHSSKALIMEVLAKRALLQRGDLTSILRSELKGELRQVTRNLYGPPRGTTNLCKHLDLEFTFW